jgi:HlyD family secretion protein
MDIARTDFKKTQQQKRLYQGVAAAVAVVAITAGLASLDPAAPSVERGAVWVDTVKRGEMLREVRGPGTLVPREVRWIPAQTDGRLERILVKPGAPVKPDTVIMELSNPDVLRAFEDSRSAANAAEADHAALRASLESQELDQRAGLAAARADYESARLQAEAEADLLKDNIVSQIQYKRSQLAADQLKVRMDIEQERVTKFGANIEAQLRASAARVEQARSTLKLRRQQFEGLRVRAGLAGVLQQLPLQEGQQVAQGQNIARVARPEELIAELRVAETQAKDISLGQSVKVDTRNGIVDGRVMRIDPAVQNGTVQVDVELTGALPPGARPDLSVDGTIEIERLANVLFVGRPAYGQPESTVSLFKLGPDGGEADRVPVQLGKSSVNVIEIRGGLAEGDQVVLSDTSQWDDYDRIELQ